MTKTIRTPADLVGEQISGVAFVRDYVEVHFDGPILRSLTKPAVSIRGVAFQHPAAGWRDALCELIGEWVSDVLIQEDVALRLETRGGVTLIIPLERGARTWPEAMHFVPGPNQPIQVW